MKMIRVKCQGKEEQPCDKAFDGCKKRVMYSESDRKVICKDGEVSVAE